VVKRYRREISVAVAILLICVLMAVTAPGFFSVENQTDLVLANIPVLIIAIGMTLVVLTGHIDISVGSMFAICSVASGVFARMGLPVIAAAVMASLAGGLLGAINGALVANVRIPAIVVTLATMVALRDGLRWTTQGAWIQDLPSGFQWFGLSQNASAFVTTAVAVFLLILAGWALRNLAVGRAVYATGSDANAARLAGISVPGVTFWAFVITGILTGCAAVLNSVRFNQIPSNAGIGLEMKVVAAVVVGGTAITGGRGTVLGTALGVVLLGMVGPALTFLGISAYWERALQGAIILVAVAMDSARLRTRSHASNVAAAAGS
jgi:rhamnose transport system permease protein